MFDVKLHLASCQNVLRSLRCSDLLMTHSQCLVRLLWHFPVFLFIFLLHDEPPRPLGSEIFIILRKNYLVKNK